MVAKGPLPLAGSVLRSFNNKGTRIAIIIEKKQAKNKEVPIIKPKIGELESKKTTDDMAITKLQIKDKIKPTPTSLKK